MAPTNALFTADDLLHLADDNLRHELVSGRLTTMSPPGFLHGICVNRLATALSIFVHARGLGVVVQDVGFVLARDPDTVRAPDIAFVAASRVHRGAATEKYWEGPPDLAIEVVSPGERAREVDAKLREYLAHGCRAVWVVRPRQRSVAVHTADTPPRVFAVPDVLEARSVLAGFTCPLAELFADPAVPRGVHANDD